MQQSVLGMTPIKIHFPAGSNLKVCAVAEEFMPFSWDLLASYLDAYAGVRQIRENFVNDQASLIKRLNVTDPAHASLEFMDIQPLSHEFEADLASPRETIHVDTQGEFKDRTQDRGRDFQVLSCMVITFLYGAWEDKYRKQFALALGLPHKSDVKSDLFGDLGYLRHAAVHNRMRATADVEKKSKLLHWFREGDQMIIPVDAVWRIYLEVDRYITQLCEIPMNS